MANDQKRSGRSLRPESPREVSSVQMADIVGHYDDGENPVILARDDTELPAAFAADNEVDPIFVGDFKQLCLYCNYDQQGSTRVAVKIKVAYKEEGPYYDLQYLDPPASGSVRLQELIYRHDEDGPFVIQQPNSGFAWIKVFVLGQGTLTNSSCEIRVARGWGN